MIDPKSSPLVLTKADGVDSEDVSKYLRGKIKAVNETNDEAPEVIDVK